MGVVGEVHVESIQVKDENGRSARVDVYVDEHDALPAVALSGD